MDLAETTRNLQNNAKENNNNNKLKWSIHDIMSFK